MKLYVYRNEDITNDKPWPAPIDEIEGDNNEQCEQQFWDRYDSNDYTAAYARY